MAFYDRQSGMATVWLLLLLVLAISAVSAKMPKTLVVPVAKDVATGQYVAHLRQRTPLVSVPAVVDLGGSFFWVDCDSGFVSSSSRKVPCGSAQCAAARSRACINDTTCGFLPNNPFTRTSSIGELAEDVLVLSSSPNGYDEGPPVVATKIVYGCGSTSLLQGLAQRAKGIAGLGRNPIALPSQLSAKFSFPRSFAICLSSTVGPAFFGAGPYFLGISAAAYYTPLLVNPKPTISHFSGQPSDEYFIGVTGIQVNQEPVSGFDPALLAINKKTGRGGTRISTAVPYGVLESSIFRALATAFATLGELQAVPPIKPFGFCFDSSKIQQTRVGLAVPTIDLVLQNAPTVWSMYSSRNTVVSVSEGVSCLAFVDGGADVTSAIVMGGYQLEDRLVEFDIARSRLRFTSPLVYRTGNCASFNFTDISL